MVEKLWTDSTHQLAADVHSIMTEESSSSDEGADWTSNIAPGGCCTLTFKVWRQSVMDAGKYWDECNAWIGMHGKKMYHMEGVLMELW